MKTVVAFDRVEHLVRVPVQVADETVPFLVDTGIGVTVVSSLLAERADVHNTGMSFSGRRMSGQVIETPLVRLPPLRLGQYEVENHVAAVADLGGDSDSAGFSGILGPGFFTYHAVINDPLESTLTIVPNDQLNADGHVVPMRVLRDGPSFDPFTDLVLPSGRTISVEIDTGSASLILSTRYMAECGVTIESPAVETTTGTDETGHAWTRHWATISGQVHLAAAAETAQSAPRVLFQDIIHDGLVGTDYLERYRVTFDITGEKMILSPQGESGR